MAAIRQPMVDIVYNDETGRYIAMLERKLLLLTLNDIKFRALLELLTDEEWEDYQFSEEDGQIQRIAQDALKRRLGLSDDDARRLVAERFERHNPPPAPDHTRTYLIGEGPSPHNVQNTRVVPSAREATGDNSPGYSVEKHLAGLSKAAARREAVQQQEP